METEGSRKGQQKQAKNEIETIGRMETFIFPLIVLPHKKMPLKLCALLFHAHRITRTRKHAETDKWNARFVGNATSCKDNLKWRRNRKRWFGDQESKSNQFNAVQSFFEWWLERCEGHEWNGQMRNFVFFCFVSLCRLVTTAQEWK